MNKLQTVLDALEKAKRQVIHANVAPHGCINEAITVVHELMAQEPVAWYDSDMDSAYTASELDGGSEEGLTPLYAAPVVVQEVPAVTDEMVSRFLCWKLPRYFYPDSFISFDRTKHDTWGGYPNSWPTGTNLFTGDQARAMLEHVIAAAPVAKGEV